MGFHQQLWGKFSKLTELYLYNFRTDNDFSSRVHKIVKYGTETISFLAPKVCALVPEKIKECSCLEAFKSKIRIAHARYAKLICNILVFFKYAHIYNLITIIVIIYRCQDILFIRMTQFR